MKCIRGCVEWMWLQAVASAELFPEQPNWAPPNHLITRSKPPHISSSPTTQCRDSTHTTMSVPSTEEQAGPRHGFSTGDLTIPMENLPSPGHDADYVPGNPARLDENGHEEEAVGTDETSEMVSQGAPRNSAARGLEATKKQLFSKVPDCAWNVSHVGQSNAV